MDGRMLLPPLEVATGFFSGFSGLKLLRCKHSHKPSELDQKLSASHSGGFSARVGTAMLVQLPFRIYYPLRVGMAAAFCYRQSPERESGNFSPCPHCSSCLPSGCG
ncbi:hypothetical protein BDFG_01462 [Blastomyces dermatitidis ATCC 26199]|nr:hypothetical protein BDFG_01462 [Blastomyces dermatitidis ATCC 26199]